MNKNEIISMLKLLEDPDDSVYGLIRQKILDDFELYRPYLENYHALSINELALERSEELLEDMFLYSYETRLESYLKQKDPSLLDGVLLIEEYFNRDVDTDLIRTETENIIQSIWLEFNDQLTGIEKVKLIGKTLFEKFNFKKFPLGDFKPEQLSFANCVNSKRYAAPNISLLYCVISQRMDIPLYPLALPGLFVLSYVDAELADAVFVEKNNGSVFYIHPFDEGEFVNHQIIEKYLSDKKIEKRLDDFGNMTYVEYLSFFFELRILALKHKNRKGFELDNADRIKEVFRRK